jgi:hypothetical protein
MAACGLLLAFGAAPAQAETSPPTQPEEITSTSQCTQPALAQPFLFAGDSNLYALAPGETAGNFNGEGWTLSGGASANMTTLRDGQQGSVLDMPGGSTAVSPTFCVTSDYPSSRAFIRDVVGRGGVSFFVSYLGTPTWEAPKKTGHVTGAGPGQWVLSPSLNMHPYDVPGWQLVRLTLIAPGKSTNDYQLYDLYIDPYAR